MPRTSIIIPAFNAAKYLNATIQSVINQSDQDWEVLIIDDGSKDNTKEALEAFLSDSRIHYYYQKNSGVSIARNNGINRAQGQYIAFLDADDAWESDNLEKKIKILNSKDTDWVYSDMLYADENMIPKGLAPMGNDQNILEDILLWEKQVIPGPCSNIIAKRKCFESGLLFDPSLSTAADQDFCIRLSSKYKGRRIPEALWRYRVLDNSMSRNIKVMQSDHIKVFKKAEQNMLFKSFWFKQRCFSNLYINLAGSWWVNGNSKTKGFYFLLRSLLTYPPNITKLLKKIFK